MGSIFDMFSGGNGGSSGSSAFSDLSNPSSLDEEEFKKRLGSNSALGYLGRGIDANFIPGGGGLSGLMSMFAR